jgi:regulator of RNase E activity RraA
MALKQATRDKLRSLGTRPIAAALAKRGLRDPYVPDMRALSATQDVLVGEACRTLEACRGGRVLIVGGAPLPLPLLMRRGIAGLVSDGQLRNASEIVRAGLPTYQRRPGAPARAIAVAAGDVILGDRAGVIVIPAALVDEVAEEASEAIAFEEFTAEQVNQGGGVYGLHIPSGERAKIAFAAWRKLKGR